MKKLFQKSVAALVTVSLALALLVGVSVNKSVKADDENLLTNPWTHTHDAWELNDAKLAQTTVSNNANGGFTANISITGWQREWYGEEYMPDDVWAYQEGWCDKPYQLTSDTNMSVTPKSTYELKFDIVNSMTTEDGTQPQEKNVTVTVKNPLDDADKFLFVTVRAPKNGSYSFDRKFTIPENYAEDHVVVQFAYGAYAYSYEISSSPFLRMMPADIREKYVFAPGTTEKVNAAGKLEFNNIAAFEVPYEEPTTKAEPEETTKAPDGSSIVVNPCTCNHQNETAAPSKSGTKKVVKPAKPLITAKNKKGKKISVSWIAVPGATKYQVRAVKGKKTIIKNTSKTSLVFKKLKKKAKYKVSVRAYNAAGYGAWSKVKKVKVKK